MGRVLEVVVATVDVDDRRGNQLGWLDVVQAGDVDGMCEDRRRPASEGESMRFIAIGACAAMAMASCAGGDESPGTEPLVSVAQAQAPEAAAPAGAAPTRAHARGLPAGAIRVERAVIVDASGFEAPMAASTLFLPSGWQPHGGVLWGQEYMCTNGYNVDWSAASPDGAESIHVLPQARWEANNYNAPPSTPGCPLATHSSVRQYLDALLQGWRPGARSLDFRRRGDIEQELAQVNRATPTAMGEMRTWVEAGELTFAYRDQAVERRGSLAAAVIFSLMRTNAGGGMPVMDALTGFALPAWGATAPADRFDPGFFEAIRRSIQANPQWESRIAGHNAAIGRVALEESRKRSEAITRSNAEIARIREEAWNATQESADRRVREFGEVIRGVETYDDPDAAGGRVELSGHYDNAWRLDDGSYVLTNDASFEPWRDLGVEGNRLEATR